MTWQATDKQRFVVSSSFQNNCNCVFNLLTTGARVTPEAAGPHKYYPNYLPSAAWTYPATSNVLLEAGVSVQALDQMDTREEGWDDTSYRVVDQGLALTYGNVATRTIPRRQFQQRFALSYLTGSHSFKAGVNVKLGRQGDIEKLGFDKTIHGTAVNYRFNNGVPNQLTLLDAPWNFEESVNDFAFYGQDQWTINRLTLNLGVRYNEVRGSTPEQVLGEGYYVPERRFEPLEKVPHYRNLSPRLGFAYDLFGTGRTAIKGSLGHYPEIVRVVTGNPANNLVRTTNRTWNDSLFPAGDARRGNYVPDCDLRNPATNGECGAWSDLNFGKQTGGTKYADGALEGFNSQYHNWQGSVSLQHELAPGIGLNVGYYRTWYGGDCGGSGLTNTVTCTLVTDNLLVTPADFDQFCITAPTDDRIPDSGSQMCGLYDVKREFFGVSDNLARPASDFGELTKVYNGIDATVNGRFGEGGSFSGGVSMGQTVEDNCIVVDSPQAARDGFCKVSPPWSAGTDMKFMLVYPLPWEIQTSVIYQNSPGIPITAQLVVPNASIVPSLGRNLSACPTHDRRRVHGQCHRRSDPGTDDVRGAPSAGGSAHLTGLPPGWQPAPAWQLRRVQPVQREQRPQHEHDVRSDVDQRDADPERPAPASRRAVRFLARSSRQSWRGGFGLRATGSPPGWLAVRPRTRLVAWLMLTTTHRAANLTGCAKTPVRFELSRLRLGSSQGGC